MHVMCLILTNPLLLLLPLVSNVIRLSHLERGDEGCMVPLGTVSIWSWVLLSSGFPLNLVLYMSFRIFAYSSNLLKTNLELIDWMPGCGTLWDCDAKCMGWGDWMHIRMIVYCKYNTCGVTWLDRKWKHPYFQEGRRYGRRRGGNFGWWFEVNLLQRGWGVLRNWCNCKCLDMKPV
jgi:hypothetical protein